MSRCGYAYAVAAARDDTPSLVKMFVTCRSTVFSAMTRSRRPHGLSCKPRPGAALSSQATSARARPRAAPSGSVAFADILVAPYQRYRARVLEPAAGAVSERLTALPAVRRARRWWRRTHSRPEEGAVTIRTIARRR